MFRGDGARLMKPSYGTGKTADYGFLVKEETHGFSETRA
jgi:hypothetical protein